MTEGLKPKDHAFLKRCCKRLQIGEEGLSAGKWFPHHASPSMQEVPQRKQAFCFFQLKDKERGSNHERQRPTVMIGSWSLPDSHAGLVDDRSCDAHYSSFVRNVRFCEYRKRRKEEKSGSKTDRKKVKGIESREEL